MLTAAGWVLQPLIARQLPLVTDTTASMTSSPIVRSAPGRGASAGSGLAVRARWTISAIANVSSRNPAPEAAEDGQAGEIRARPRRNAYSTYVMLEIHNTNLTVGVPVENAEEVGLRKILDAGQMEALFDVLRGPSRPEDPQWADDPAMQEYKAGM